MSEQTKTKKKMSSFGKLWFSLLLAAEVLPLWYLVEGWSFRIFQDQLLFIFQVPTILYVILTCVWLIVGRKKWLFPGKWVALSPLPIFLRWLSTLWLPYRMYTFSIISEMVFTFLFATILPILSLVVLWVLYGQSLKKAPKKANVVGSLTYANSTVTIPMGESEQVLLERHFNSIAPFILFLAAIVGTIIGIDMLNWYYTRDTGTIFLLGSLLLVVIGVLILSFGKIHLYITNKRVYVQAALGYRRSLPLNRISSVSTGLFNCLQITSAAGLVGQIQVFLLPGHLEAYNTINALLGEVE